MGDLVDPKVHAGEPLYGTGEPHWETRTGATGERCSYCGSQSVADVVRLLRTPGTDFSGTDKTSYKAYVGNHQKFYFRHLRACTDAELAEFDVLSRKVFGLAWFRKDGELVCRSPRSRGFYGWQTWGKVGPDGEPVFDEASPRPPDDAWWSAALAAPLEGP